jgi:hypothetical protein
MPNAKTPLTCALAVVATALVAAAPAAAGDEVGPGGLPKKLVLLYKHKDDNDFTYKDSDGNPVHQTRALVLRARIPLTLSKRGTARGKGALQYKKAQFHEVTDGTSVGQGVRCSYHDETDLTSTTDSTAHASIEVGRATRKRKIGPITVVFDPGYPQETLHDKLVTTSGSCPSRESDKPGYVWLGTFQQFWGDAFDVGTGDLTITTIRPHKGAYLGTGRLASPFPDRDDGFYKDEFVLLKR